MPENDDERSRGPGEAPPSNRGPLRRDQLAAVLPTLLGPIDEAILRDVEAQVEWVRLRGGEMLFRQQDAGDSLYVLVSGRLRAMQEDETGAQRILNEIAPGETVGEMAVITGEPRSASICAIRDSELARLSTQACERISMQYPQVMAGIARVLVDRLRASQGPRSGARRVTNLAVVPVRADAPATDLADRLAAALAPVSPVLRLSAERVDRLLNRPGAAQVGHDDPYSATLGAWLEQQEASHRFVLYEADRSASAWTRRCVRQADEILLVAEADSDPARGEIETALFGPAEALTTARRSLVLLHRSGNRLPTGTARWLAEREVAAHYHIRLDRDADFSRLARCLSGRGIGLALGGGGARGFAHIGVVRALREAGVPIDMIAGTSMGAIVGSQGGLDTDWQEMLRLARVYFIDHKPHKEYTLPMISILRSREFDRLMREAYGETQIEDTWVSFVCVSCNLTTTEMRVHQRGLLWKAVRASASLPGMFVPVLEGPNLLVDGGVVNYLPGDVLREASCGPLIVANVSPSRDLSADFEEFPSPWQVLWGKLLPFRKPLKVPGILEILSRATMVGSDRRAGYVEADADLCLRPPVVRYGLMEFEALEHIVEAGYQYTQRELAKRENEEWLRQITAS